MLSILLSLHRYDFCWICESILSKKRHDATYIQAGIKGTVARTLGSKYQQHQHYDRALLKLRSSRKPRALCHQFALEELRPNKPCVGQWGLSTVTSAKPSLAQPFLFYISNQVAVVLVSQIYPDFQPLSWFFKFSLENS